jgi:hypothetical protein
MRLFLRTMGLVSVGALMLQGAIAPLPQLSLTNPAIAQQNQRRAYKPPPPPKSRPRGQNPAKTVRNDCPEVPAPVTALAPSDREPSTNVTLVWGQTTAQRPTLWFYLPYSRQDGNLPTHLIIQTDLGKEKKWRFSLPPQPGIVAISLPQEMPLEAGKPYRWILEVECGRKGVDDVYGWIQFTPPSTNLAQKLKLAGPVQQAVLYAENGYWYDAINQLAQLQRQQPNHSAAKELWQTLLEDENLGALKNQAIAGYLEQQTK